MLSDKEVSGPALRAEIGDRMRRSRENLKITPQQAAHQFGVSVAELRDWETGRTSPGVAALREMASFYRISADGLLGMHSEEQFREDLHLSAYRRLDPVQQRSIQLIVSKIAETRRRP